MKLVPGTDIYVPDHDDHFYSAVKDGRPVAPTYQKDRFEAACRFLKGRHRLAIDGGAHVGLFTRHMAAVFDQVLSFEPNPHNFECLVANTKHLPNVKVFNQALGKEAQTIESLAPNPDNSGDCYVQPARQGVQMITIDSLDLPALDLLKLDLQGYEYYALAGATKTLHKHRPVCIVEVEGATKLKNKYDIVNDAAPRILAKQGATLAQKIGADQIFTFPGLTAVAFDKYAKAGDYHWQKYQKLESYRNMMDGVVDVIVKNGERRVLDVGCGDGLLCMLLREKGVKTLGIDNDAVGIEIAVQKGANARLGNVYDASKIGKKFDAACLLDVLEHLVEQEIAIHELGKVTNRLYILNPEPCGSRYHTREFTADELQAFMERLGWTVIHRQDFRKSVRDVRCLFVCDKGVTHAVQPGESQSGLQEGVGGSEAVPSDQ